ncbi:helix-turn-helix domain-containing protein [Paenibacillus sp. TRM 82003]|uniref:helix-turn-helix domain-containing protein n=1 Tax=Kineococcus sp. TRM81007 TaxID=2925831 RepID=UPI001F568B80|nr:helix-turn-helix domain-containing protein [Kineococcus sp. TRM81007]MCI2238121.1 helix-turn-helix domain-containing protein [Kineococcus sp. TRM81007]MCI3920505.1 helix-turn-helix domain-containing protein [Paenibacillus sp. TRM 82003]
MSNRPPTPDAPRPAPDDTSLVIEEPRFALVPEWVIDAKIPDSSFRLYSLLLRYGGSSGTRMPSRATLARRMNRSVDAVDRAMRALVDAGIVRVEHRRNGQQNLTNRYHVRTSPPALDGAAEGGRGSAATRTETASQTPGGRTDAATVDEEIGGRTPAATGGRATAATPGRAPAGRVAADVRHDPEFSTQSTSPPPAPAAPSARAGRREVEEGAAALLSDCGITDLSDLTGRCQNARRALGKPTNRWAEHCLAAALHLAVRGRGWPAEAAVPALLAVAADPQTQSPMRLAEAGPWWDVDPRAAAAAADPQAAAELAGLEERLAELGGRRPAIQASARRELAAEGMPVTRSTVVRRACQILDRQGPTR